MVKEGAERKNSDLLLFLRSGWPWTCCPSTRGTPWTWRACEGLRGCLKFAIFFVKWGHRIGLKSAPVVLENIFTKAEQNENMLNFGSKNKNWDEKNTTAGSGKDVDLEIKAIISANILHKDIVYTLKSLFWILSNYIK